ncbi:hypothetical protein CONCODRAFT_7163 [Conidiobolus coronatus NRRL 28638]|uniref:F-box domain-containing protein n=1 Tax=Conidiobolus coronatus (strain ATCC 28846 / CBS 209.66 / NRRL 28638) TaxID=796925 RepID=A0A137P5P1_CONC2|nr:hypothetical protein CONCODRAFT_7163 [Conidiobolus coronatus NRRL 28638]|eukprot:KXN70323.1 hypothetical protein CONCODRAFT_7163 [Conidiobolus coronatus NRRL 28638]
MKDSDWIVILRLKEFSSYLNNSDLIQLSLECKLFRKCLTPVIFSNFNFTPFAEIGCYNNCVISNNEYKSDHNRTYIHNPFKPLSTDLDKSKAQFNFELKLLHNKPKKLLVYDADFYYHLLYDIPSVFTKLTTIIISDSSLHYEIFQYLLDNVYCLNTLELSNSILIQSAQSPYLIPVSWSNSLKKLKACNNKIVRIDDRQSNLLFVNGHVQGNSIDQLSFSLKCLPKLVYFEYQLFLEQFDDENFWEFLKLNSQIRCLKIRVTEFHLELFEAIQHITCLSSLDLKFIAYNNFEVDYNDLPVINSVAFLTITLYNRPDINDIIIDKFPNLAELTVEMDSKDSYRLINLTKRLSGLRCLNLKIKLEYLYIDDFDFPKLDNLKSLEFILGWSIYLKEVIWNVDSCSNLKLVKFTNIYHCVYRDEPKMNPELVGNWEIVYFPHKVTYYRALR